MYVFVVCTVNREISHVVDKGFGADLRSKIMEGATSFTMVVDIQHAMLF